MVNEIVDDLKVILEHLNDLEAEVLDIDYRVDDTLLGSVDELAGGLDDIGQQTENARSSILSLIEIVEERIAAYTGLSTPKPTPKRVRKSKPAKKR